jgi:hypothetical protein
MVGISVEPASNEHKILNTKLDILGGVWGLEVARGRLLKNFLPRNWDVEARRHFG